MESLFFELASESRLGMLQELKLKSLKMKDLTSKLHLTATESFRQLQRLSEEQLVEKQPDGTYSLTEYSRLILHLTPTLDFVHRYKEYFSTRNILKLPYEFINRIGELSSGTLSTNITDSINKGEKMVKESQRHVWAIGDKALDSIGSLMLERYSKGVKSFRFMYAESLLPLYRPSQHQPGIEQRTLPAIPALIICTGNESAVCFLSTQDKVDYTGFFGQEPVFRKWVEDFFNHYWSLGKIVLPG